MAILTLSHRRVAMVAAALAVAATPALAQDLSPVTNFFTTIGEAITGALGTAIALVAIAAIGLMFLMGRMNWMFAGSVMLGVVILFGAGTILAGMGGGA